MFPPPDKDTTIWENRLKWGFKRGPTPSEPVIVAMAWALKLPLTDEVIESGLAQDFDASLSGIGQELGAGAYSMRYRTTFPVLNIMYNEFKVVKTTHWRWWRFVKCVESCKLNRKRHAVLIAHIYTFILILIYVLCLFSFWDILYICKKNQNQNQTNKLEKQYSPLWLSE